MNIQDIVKKYLEENGYDGLYDPDNPCGCSKDDLFPCGTCYFPFQCEPGYHCKLDADEWGEDEWGFGPNKEQEQSEREEQ